MIANYQCNGRDHKADLPAKYAVWCKSRFAIGTRVVRILGENPADGVQDGPARDKVERKNGC